MNNWYYREAHGLSDSGGGWKHAWEIIELPEQVYDVRRASTVGFILAEENAKLVATKLDMLYKPDYGDDKVCQCGHPYYRHFDSYEHMAPIGCKYCGCYNFQEERKHVKKQTT
jgi:hypothetical protein